MNTLKTIIFTIFHPSYWVMNERYSRSWDEQLNKLLDEHRFTDFTEYTAILGGNEVWTENHPYASFRPWIGHGCARFRAGRLTIHRANKRLEEDIVLWVIEKINESE